MNLLPRSVRKLFFNLREFICSNLLGYPMDDFIDLRVWPESLHMDPFEFDEFRKANRDKREGKSR